MNYILFSSFYNGESIYTKMYTSQNKGWKMLQILNWNNAWSKQTLHKGSETLNKAENKG
jgi:hypothetical protein